MTIFAALQLMDALTTLVFLRLGVHEGNATMAWLMVRIGIVPALFLSKAVMIGATSVLTVLRVGRTGSTARSSCGTCWRSDWRD
jgi:hypothetical protein